VKIIVCRLIFAAAMLAAVLGFGIGTSRAGTYGDEKWCAVSNDGGDALNWDCEYDTVDDCSPAIIVGNRGFCALNPYWRPPDPATKSQR
jgi:hypothetical protein